MWAKRVEYGNNNLVLLELWHFPSYFRYSAPPSMYPLKTISKREIKTTIYGNWLVLASYYICTAIIQTFIMVFNWFSFTIIIGWVKIHSSIITILFTIIPSFMRQNAIIIVWARQVTILFTIINNYYNSKPKFFMRHNIFTILYYSTIIIIIAVYETGHWVQSPQCVTNKTRHIYRFCQRQITLSSL